MYSLHCFSGLWTHNSVSQLESQESSAYDGSGSKTEVFGCLAGGQQVKHFSLAGAGFEMSFSDQEQRYVPQQNRTKNHFSWYPVFDGNQCCQCFRGRHNAPMGI